MRSNTTYASFIITYKRKEILSHTLKKLFQQTDPPGQVLIIDNDPDLSAKELALGSYPVPVNYHAMGYNAGPAGAANAGMKILFEQGWEWVLWVDDNDAPLFADAVENIFKIPVQYGQPQNIGMIGAVGVRFNKKKAITNRLKDSELKGVVEVDNIAGNMLPLINRRVYEKNILPDPAIFFGFEELEFSLSVKRSGLAVLVSGEEMLRYRRATGRIGFTRELYTKKDLRRLWREYYSVRNIIYIILYKEKNFYGFFYLTIKNLAKLLFGFRFGIKYGSQNFIFLAKGLIHGCFRLMGNRVKTA